MPRTFTAIACKLLAANRRVNVALEISKSDQPLIDAYLASGGSLDDQKAFLAQRDWSRKDERQDGRFSIAMFEIIEWVRLQKALGWPINLFAFDASELRTAGHTRDTMMAENITLVAARDSHDNSAITLVLAGNWHASRAPRHGSSDDPAGMYLNMPSVIAFDMIPSGGTAWQMSGGRGG